MDKADRDRIKIALAKLDRNPFFVYAPAKKALLGGSDPKLEFTLTIAQREERFQELRKKHGDKVVKGRVEAADTGDLTFRTVRKPPKEFGIDLKKMGQKVSGLVGAAIVEGDDDANERDDGGNATAAKNVAHALAVESNVKGNADQHVAAIKDKALKDRVSKALNVLPAIAAAVEKLEARAEKASTTEWRTYGREIFDTFVDELKDEKEALRVARDEELDAEDEHVAAELDLELVKQKKGDPKDAEAKLKKAKENKESKHYAVGAAEARIKTIELGKGEIEQLWGTISALSRAATTKVTAAVKLVAAANDARTQAKTSKDLAKLANLIQQAGQAAESARPDVRKLEEAIAVFQRRAEDIVGWRPIVPVEIEDKDDGNAPSSSPVDPIVAMHKTVTALAANPLTAEIADKVGVVHDLRKKALTPAAPKSKHDVPPTPDQIKDALVHLVLITKTPATALTTRINGLGTVDDAVTFARELATAPNHGSAAVTQHVKAAQEWCVRADSNGGVDKIVEAFASANGGPLAAPPKAALEAIKKIAGLDDVGAREAFGSIEYPDEPGKLGPVRVTDSTKVIVVGGGPIGLMAAIEARLKGSRVTVFEGRPDPYSRQNVLKINDTTSTRLVRYGVGKDLGVVSDKGVITYGNIPVAKLEDALANRAEALGVGFVRGLHVTEVDSDTDTGEVLVSFSGRDRPEAASLLIVAVGAGINAKNRHAGNIVMAEQLGIKMETFAQKDYATAGVFKAPTQGQAEVNPEIGDLDDKLAWEVVLKTTDSSYKLTQLSKDEYELVKDDPKELQTLLLGRVGAMKQMKGLDLAHSGRFEIVIQKAQSMVSSKGKAVLVGDSVATPHPNTGSGTNTGANEVTIVGDLVTDFVLAARALSGNRALKDQALLRYDKDMGEIAKKQSEKGIQEMLRLRKDRVRRLGRVIAELRDGVKGLVKTQPGTDQIARFWKHYTVAGEALEAFATVDLSSGSGAWGKASKIIEALDRIEGEMRTVHTALTKEADPVKFEQLLARDLAKVELKVT